MWMHHLYFQCKTRGSRSGYDHNASPLRTMVPKGPMQTSKGGIQPKLYPTITLEMLLYTNIKSLCQYSKSNQAKCGIKSPDLMSKNLQGGFREKEKACREKHLATGEPYIKQSAGMGLDIIRGELLFFSG